MGGKTFLCILIILLAVFSFVTYYKLKDFPTGDACCKDIKNPSSEVCHTCDYTFTEKVIYVWRFS